MNELPDGLVNAIENCREELGEKVFRLNKLELITNIYGSENLSNYIGYNSFDEVKYLTLSQSKKADLLGVSKSTYQNWETGKKPFSVKLVERLRTKEVIDNDLMFTSDNPKFSKIIAGAIFAYEMSSRIHYNNKGKKIEVNPKIIIDKKGNFENCDLFLNYIGIKNNSALDKKGNKIYRFSDSILSYLVFALAPQLNLERKQRDDKGSYLKKLFPKMSYEIENYIHKQIRSTSNIGSEQCLKPFLKKYIEREMA